MPTSTETNKKVKEIIDKYITPDNAKKMFSELEQVPGNASFKTSIQRLKELFKDGK